MHKRQFQERFLDRIILIAMDAALHILLDFISLHTQVRA
jgi:hypothetical protein